VVPVCTVELFSSGPSTSKLVSTSDGLKLIGTIFILVVLAALGGFMVKLSMVQSSSSALTLQSARAWFAAVSGLEWTTYQIRNSSACPTVPTSFTLEGFTINLSRCDTYPVTEGANSYTLYDVELTASFNSFGNPDFVSRTIRATITGS